MNNQPIESGDSMCKFQVGQAVRVAHSPYLSLPAGTVGEIVEVLPFEPWANDGLVRVAFHGTSTTWAMLQSWLERAETCGICRGEGSLEDEGEDAEGLSIAYYSACHACRGKGIV